MDNECVLRTQIQLDRETNDHYALNVSVKNENQTDYASVFVDVTDINDNAPRFHGNNDYENNAYFVAVTADSRAKTRILTVKVILYSCCKVIIVSHFFSRENSCPQNDLGFERICNYSAALSK